MLYLFFNCDCVTYPQVGKWYCVAAQWSRGESSHGWVREPPPNGKQADGGEGRIGLWILVRLRTNSKQSLGTEGSLSETGTSPHHDFYISHGPVDRYKKTYPKVLSFLNITCSTLLCALYVYHVGLLPCKYKLQFSTPCFCTLQFVFFCVYFHPVPDNCLHTLFSSYPCTIITTVYCNKYIIIPLLDNELTSIVCVEYPSIAQVVNMLWYVCFSVW